MVVGGGNTAVGDAIYLSRIAAKVILVHRRDTLRATKIYHGKLEECPNIELLWNSRIEEILSESGAVKGVVIADTKSGETRQITCDGVFVSIGREPNTALLRDTSLLDEKGYIIAGEDTETKIAGVYAAGDVRRKHLRQVVTAAADGAVAIDRIEEYLLNH